MRSPLSLYLYLYYSASFTTKFASYELVPNDIQSKLIADHEEELAKEAE